MNTPTSPQASPSTHVPPVYNSADKATIIVFWLAPFLGLLGAIAFHVWHGTFDWFYVWLFIGCYVVTGFGTTVWYHRFFTHASFEVGPFMEYVGGITGAMAAQGQIVTWCSIHQHHHAHSDEADDPHSPWKYCLDVEGRPTRVSFRNLWLGFWHAQFGWMLKGLPIPQNAAYKRLTADPIVSFVDRHIGLWILLGFLIPAGLGFWHEGTWKGALFGFLWGGAIRLFIHQHVTSMVNSYCHLWGSRDVSTSDRSQNSWIIGFLALGEGWHNYHHAFPNSSLHGMDHPYFDASYVFIKLMELCGLAWCTGKGIPRPERLEQRRIEAEAESQ